jgi:hypothetical protein
MLIFCIVLLDANNGFLFENTTTTDQQSHAGGIVTPDGCVIPKDVGCPSRNSGKKLFSFYLVV